MTTKNYQPVYRDLSDTIAMRCLKEDIINMGDILYWDVANRIARPLNSDANVATLLGMASESNQVSQHGPLDRIAANCKKDHCVRLQILGAEAIDQFTPVYWGGDAQTVTTVEGTNTLKIGCIILPFEEGAYPRTTVAKERVHVMLVRSYMYAIQLANV